MVVGFIKEPNQPVNLVPGFLAETAYGLKGLIRRDRRLDRGPWRCRWCAWYAPAHDLHRQISERFDERLNHCRLFTLEHPLFHLPDLVKIG